MYSTVVIQSKMTIYTSLVHLIADKAKSLGIPFIGVQEVYNEVIAILRPDSFNCLSGFNLYQVEQQTWVVLCKSSGSVRSMNIADSCLSRTQ